MKIKVQEYDEKQYMLLYSVEDLTQKYYDKTNEETNKIMDDNPSLKEQKSLREYLTNPKVNKEKCRVEMKKSVQGSMYNKP